MATLPPSPSFARNMANRRPACPGDALAICHANQENGAGNETRTRDPDLGKVVLYQLSYSRIEQAAYSKRNRLGVKRSAARNSARPLSPTGSCPPLPWKIRQPRTKPQHHSPLEGESARQGRKPAAAPVGGGAPARRPVVGLTPAPFRIELRFLLRGDGFCWFVVLAWWVLSAGLDGLCMPSMARLCRLR